MPRKYITDFTERAEVAYQRLSDISRRRIDNALLRIEQSGLRPPLVRKVYGPDRMYIARAGNLRIIFALEDDILTILDIVTHDNIQRLSRLYDWGKEV